MNIEQPQYCLCGAFLGRERISKGLDKCYQCESIAKREQEDVEKLLEQMRNINRANQKVRS